MNSRTTRTPFSRNERKRIVICLAALGLIFSGLVAAGPANAAQPMSSAEKIRRLDIMLMVTALRCRNTPSDFEADYGRFTASQLPLLNLASARLEAELAASGQRGAHVLDRVSTVMANRYGQGHPWLGCDELGQVARYLAVVHGAETLAEAADQLLAPEEPVRLAYLGR